MDPLDRLTRAVARTIGDGPDPRRRARQRRAVANLPVTPPFDRRWWWLVPLGAAVVLALAWARPRPRHPSLVAAATPSAGAHFTASDQPLPVTFTDHSRVVLAPRASARLTTLDPHHVHLTLERGHLDVTVTPDPDRDFSVTAGPFTVDVTGTAFTLDWLPDSTTLTIAVAHGHVRVHGGSLGDGTRLSAGQRLTTTPVDPAPANDATASAQSPHPTNAPPADPQSPHPTNAPPADPQSPHPANAPPGAGERSPRASAPVGWRALADDGDHPGALAAAERAGFAALLERLDAADLERLAHSARLAGAAGPAHDALQTLRRRYPADPRAATATFLLGRVALDLAHDPVAAAAWFAAYTTRDPHGPLAADARGRRLQILHDLGEVTSARVAASEYLQHHPSGARSDLARKILGTP